MTTGENRMDFKELPSRVSQEEYRKTGKWDWPAEVGGQWINKLKTICGQGPLPEDYEGIQMLFDLQETIRVAAEFHQEKMLAENKILRDALLSIDGGADGLDAAEDDGSSPDYRSEYHEQADIARKALKEVVQ